MSDYSSQPVEDFPPTVNTLNVKRAGRPPYEKSMPGKIDKVKKLNDQGFVPKITITWTNEQLFPGWEDKLVVGHVDSRCVAMVINSAEVLVQLQFDRRANTYNHDAEKQKSDTEASERKAYVLKRQLADYENLSNVFGSSSVRHVI